MPAGGGLRGGGEPISLRSGEMGGPRIIHANPALSVKLDDVERE